MVRIVKIDKKRTPQEEVERQKEIGNAIYGNCSTCGNLKELAWLDEQYSPIDIREEDASLRIDELRSPRTWEIAGGSGSQSLYPKEWTYTLRQSIKRRDNFTCYVCQDEENIVAYHVHHIDYDKQNCCESNLITLCFSCHMKTNRDREQWQKFFEDNI